MNTENKTVSSMSINKTCAKLSVVIMALTDMTGTVVGNFDYKDKEKRIHYTENKKRFSLSTYCLLVRVYRLVQGMKQEGSSTR